MEGTAQLSLELNSVPVLSTVKQEAEHELLGYNAV
jgi:hypothetical protein